MIGPGRYDDITTRLRELTDADGVVLIVLNGYKGSGFSVQVPEPQDGFQLATVLRAVADEVTKDTIETKVGESGGFPHGQISPDDEGELAIAMSVNPGTQVITLQFGKLVSWLGMDLLTARTIRDKLAESIKTLEAGGN